MKYHFLLISKNNRGRNLSQTYYAKGHFFPNPDHFAWVLESFTVNFLYSCGQNFLGTWEAKPSNACYRFIFKIIAHFEKDLLSGLRKRFQMRCWSQSSPETTSERGSTQPANFSTIAALCGLTFPCLQNLSWQNFSSGMRRRNGPRSSAW